MKRDPAAGGCGPETRGLTTGDASTRRRASRRDIAGRLTTGDASTRRRASRRDIAGRLTPCRRSRAPGLAFAVAVAVAAPAASARAQPGEARERALFVSIDVAP